MSPKYQIRQEAIDDLLASIEAYKKELDLSWDDVAKLTSIHKRTILRWRKKRKISRCYFRLLSELLPRLRGKHIILRSSYRPYV